MASFLKRLFGLGGGGGEEAGGSPEGAPTAKAIEHDGFTIKATPYKDGGQYQLCGIIEKDVGGELKTHRYIRAEKFAALDDAVEMTLAKGRQIVDQNGERVFKAG